MPDPLEMSWERALSIWWAFVWRAVVASALIGAVVGAIGGGMIAVVTGSAEFSGIVGGVLGYAGSIPASVWALRTSLRKRYRHFQVGLVAN